MHTLNNEQLITIKPNHEGNMLRGNKFINYEDVELPSFSKVLKWRFTKNPQRIEKKNNTWRLHVVSDNTIFSDTRNKLVWLGHASFLLTINGKNILLDPVFGDIPFIKRLIPFPASTDSIKQIDYVLLSHAHFDHCDKRSMQILAKQNPQMLILAPLKSTALLKSFDKSIRVQEAGWYQQFQLNDEQIEVYFMPAFHWYKRSMNDDNEILWGSFIIRVNGITLFFMGDSGYNAHFKEIAKFFPQIDYCMMGVGAYKPSYMMKTSHTSPVEAVQAFEDLKGKYFIPMHYGTFDLADEPIEEPIKILREFEAEGRLKGKLIAPSVGEVILLPES